MPAVELGATNSAQFMKALYARGVALRAGPGAAWRARAKATGSWPRFRNMYTEAREELRADHVVVEHGTLPADELYHGLKAGSRNHGEIDLDGPGTGGRRSSSQSRRALPAVPGRRRGGQPQHPRGDLRLLRLCKDF